MRAFRLANGALLLLIVLLAMLAIETLRRAELGGQATEWLGIPLDSVQHIRIQREGAPEIHIERTGQDWLMSSPIEVPADTLRIERMLDDLRHSSATPIPTQKSELATYGLAAPRARLWLNTHLLAFGLVNLLNYQRYVLHEGQVYLAEDQVLPLLNGQELFFAAHDLLPPGFHPIFLEFGTQRLDLREGNETISSERALRIATAWINVRAALVERLRESREEKEPLWLENRDGERLGFVLLARQPELILARPDWGIEYHFNLGMTEDLLPGAVALAPGGEGKTRPGANDKAGQNPSPD